MIQIESTDDRKGEYLHFLLAPKPKTFAAFNYKYIKNYDEADQDNYYYLYDSNFLFENILFDFLLTDNREFVGLTWIITENNLKNTDLICSSIDNFTYKILDRGTSEYNKVCFKNFDLNHINKKDFIGRVIINFTSLNDYHVEPIIDHYVYSILYRNNCSFYLRGFSVRYFEFNFPNYYLPREDILLY